MDYPLLLENKKKQQELPVWMLIFFAMFTFWQMGFIYFMGPSLTIDGRTPLPVSMDNITMLIIEAYILSILWMIFLPKTVIHTGRIATAVSLVCAVGLFFSLPEEALRLLIYLQVFFCCFMIGFETFLMVNYFTEHSTIRHLTVAYGISLILIAIVQNDIRPITFPFFRTATVIALVLLLIFFLRMPGKASACPRYVKKKDGITPPKKLLIGTYVLIFIGSLMAVSGPAIAGEVHNGVFILYTADAAASLLMYFLYKKANFHPFRSISIFIGIGCVGFILMFAASFVPYLSYIACALIGFGMVPCQMVPLYNVMLMKSYPSRYLAPCTIGLALIAVLVQSSMVEMFRNAATMLYLIYAVIMVVLVIIYLQIEPFFLYTLRRKMLIAKDSSPKNEKQIYDDDIPKNNILGELSRREMEVVDLIGQGYSNKDIAKMLFISEHTVKDHTKNIYRKMNVHSRLELAALVSKLKNEK